MKNMGNKKKKKKKKIDGLFKGEITLAKLRKQTIRRNKTSVNRSLEIYQRKIVEMDGISDKWHDLEVNNRFTETTNAIETALHLYKDTFQTLTQAIHSARPEHLHPSLLTTSSLNKTSYVKLTIYTLDTNSLYR